MPSPNSLQKWFAIRRKPAPQAAGSADPAPSHAEILIYGDIGQDYWSETVTAADFVKELSGLAVDAITVRINSIGGSVPDGLAIYNALVRHPATITTAIDGMALSVASLIAMAGDKREMAENAVLMIHAPWTYAAGNAADLREQADVLDTWAKAMATSYAAGSGKSVEDCLALLTDGTDHYYTAAEALAEGFVSEVVSAIPPAAMASVKAMADARYRNQPRTPTPAAAAATLLENPMPGTQPAAPVAKSEAEIRAAALAADQERRNGIATAFARFTGAEGVSALLTACQNDHQCDVQAANAKLLDHLGKSAGPVAGGVVYTVKDERDKIVDAAVNAIMARAAIKGRDGKTVHADGSNPFRGYSLMDMAVASLRRAGNGANGASKSQIVAAAFQSTSDFPVILENVMHKTLQAAYATQPDTWSRFCATSSVSDFRDHNRYLLGSIGDLDDIPESGEYKTAVIPDAGKQTVRAGTKGKIIGITREMIINDDMSLLVQIPQMIGRGAKRGIEQRVYRLLSENSGMGPTMADGKTLFHADHGNISDDGVMSVAVFDSVRVKMASQKEPGGNDYLDLSPQFLLCSTAQRGLATTINGAEFDPSDNKPQKPNMVRNQYSDIIDTPRLTGPRFYSFADFKLRPVVDIAFLDGIQEPYLEQQQGFDSDTLRWKVRFDYGVNAVGYQGAVTSKGAA